MDKIEVFEIDDDFDPLEEVGLEDDEEFEGKDADTDYQVPVIPDADKSVVVQAVQLPAEERIDKLVCGLPGQKFRLLEGVRVCEEPRTLDEAAAALEAAFPQGASVYPATRIIELLADAGALERIGEKDPEASESASDAGVREEGAAPAQQVSQAWNEVDTRARGGLDGGAEDFERVESISWDDVQGSVTYEEIERKAPVMYAATEAGRQAVRDRWSAHAAAQVVADEPEYLPIWKKVLELCCAEGGATKTAIAAQVDDDPLLKEPRRWCQYFLGKYKDVNALQWDKTWQITDIGRELLDSGLFASGRAVQGDADVREKQCAERTIA